MFLSTNRILICVEIKYEWKESPLFSRSHANTRNNAETARNNAETARNNAE